MIGWTRRPVSGAATHKAGRSSRLDPNDWNIRDMFAFWSAKPIWIPKKPNEMLNRPARDWRGFSSRCASVMLPLPYTVPQGCQKRSGRTTHGRARKGGRIRILSAYEVRVVSRTIR